MWVTKLFDFSSKKKDFLPKNDQIWPKIGIFGQFGPGHAGLFGVGQSVGGCGARAVSRKTPIYFIVSCDCLRTKEIAFKMKRSSDANCNHRDNTEMPK